MGMAWYPTTHEDYAMLKGYGVYTSDHKKVGHLRQVYHQNTDMPDARGHQIFLVDPGLARELFTHDHDVYIPERMIHSVDTQLEKIFLNVPEEMVGQQDWERPADLDAYVTSR